MVHKHVPDPYKDWVAHLGPVVMQYLHKCPPEARDLHKALLANIVSLLTDTKTRWIPDVNILAYFADSPIA